ncbi:hypothetical protein Pcinc_003154 [Petrolisthes cinctipes]|uniref:Uncharacterized protein n=1 Tax=Petrolisthes cinctipes TaxID=88211 RepID=A0AAE1L4W6_PETCI|nr:hypothetical protein Pcinc_003154 [Petrolisthes cinctipes]
MWVGESEGVGEGGWVGRGKGGEVHEDLRRSISANLRSTSRAYNSTSRLRDAVPEGPCCGSIAFLRRGVESGVVVYHWRCRGVERWSNTRCGEWRGREHDVELESGPRGMESGVVELRGLEGGPAGTRGLKSGVVELCSLKSVTRSMASSRPNDEGSGSEVLDLSALFDNPVSVHNPSSKIHDTQVIEEMPITMENLVLNQKSDPTLTKYIDKVIVGSDVQDSPCLIVKKGVLMRKYVPKNVPADAAWAEVHKIVLPSVYKQHVLS